MEDALSMQGPFLSAGLEAEKARKLNLTMAVCGLAYRNPKEKGSKGERVILIEDSPWDWDGISRASTHKSSPSCIDSFTKERHR